MKRVMYLESFNKVMPKSSRRKKSQPDIKPDDAQLAWVAALQWAEERDQPLAEQIQNMSPGEFAKQARQYAISVLGLHWCSRVMKWDAPAAGEAYAAWLRGDRYGAEERLYWAKEDLK